MVRDAESHAADDHKKREEIEARNRLDGLVYQTEKSLGENREKLSAADIETCEKALAQARKALEEGGGEVLARAMEDLTKASHRLAESLYRSAGADSGAAGAGPSDAGSSGPASGQASAEGDVIDAEVVDKK